ncbi:MAG TPA: acetyl-CoA carboxylase biotin carboxyl carrier protein [Candidatus Polarisedimenticolaceae bacterium]|nr:acetyl-CoA carboxylase biotin carboxyl carrier protein [Candidatus Polarisedimenticolaceae bacterium]
MDPKQLRELIEFVSRSNLATFELETDDLKLKLVKETAATAAAPAAPVFVVAPAPPTAPAAPAPAAAPSELVPPSTAPPAALAEAAPPPAEAGFVDLRSPIVGTFYRSASPEAPAFVEVGTRVRKGQVLCIVEAMKLMNEIESEIDAEVVEIRVANGQPVEYGEVLFRLRPVSA